MAYLDETYRVAEDGPTYYVMTAAVIAADQRDIVRADLREIVAGNYWHTSEALQTTAGQATTRQLLDYLADPAATEAYFIAHEEPIASDDVQGETARAACLSSLFAHLGGSSGSGAVELFVLESTATRSQAELRTCSQGSPICAR